MVFEHLSSDGSGMTRVDYRKVVKATVLQPSHEQLESVPDPSSDRPWWAPDEVISGGLTPTAQADVAVLPTSILWPMKQDPAAVDVGPRGTVGVRGIDSW